MSVFDKMFLLDGLNSKEKESVISSFSPTIKYSKGETIYSSENFFNAIGFVISGMVSAVADNDTKMVMKKFSPGMSFGAAALFGSSKQYISTVTAEKPSEILFITEPQLRNLFAEYPQIAINYISFLSDKVRFLNSKLSVVSCSAAEDTVLKYLISCVDVDGYALLPKSMTLLSKMLGVSRASLYRSLDALENNGLIKRENSKIKVIKNEKNS